MMPRQSANEFATFDWSGKVGRSQSPASSLNELHLKRQRTVFFSGFSPEIFLQSMELITYIGSESFTQGIRSAKSGEYFYWEHLIFNTLPALTYEDQEGPPFSCGGVLGIHALSNMLEHLICGDIPICFKSPARFNFHERPKYLYLCQCVI